MNLSIFDRGGHLSEELRQFAERRLSFALSRFTSRIKRVSLVLDEVTGPGGGVETRCRITVTLRRAEEITITDQAADVADCLTRIAQRTERSVARSIEQTQRFDRLGDLGGML